MENSLTVREFIAKHGAAALNNHITHFEGKQRTVRMDKGDIRFLSEPRNLDCGFRLYAEAEDKGCVWLYPNDKIGDIVEGI